LQLLDGFAEAQLDLDITAFEDGDISDDAIDDLQGPVGPRRRCFLEGGCEYSRGIGHDELIPCRGGTCAGDAILE
jgi:hypothetical protein